MAILALILLPFLALASDRCSNCPEGAKRYCLELRKTLFQVPERAVGDLNDEELEAARAAFAKRLLRRVKSLQEDLSWILKRGRTFEDVVQDFMRRKLTDGAWKHHLDLLRGAQCPPAYESEIAKNLLRDVVDRRHLVRFSSKAIESRESTPTSLPGRDFATVHDLVERLDGFPRSLHQQKLAFVARCLLGAPPDRAVRIVQVLLGLPSYSATTFRRDLRCAEEHLARVEACPLDPVGGGFVGHPALLDDVGRHLGPWPPLPPERPWPVAVSERDAESPSSAAENVARRVLGEELATDPEFVELAIRAARSPDVLSGKDPTTIRRTNPVIVWLRPLIEATTARAARIGHPGARTLVAPGR